jgi:RND family efflux transporter MFP subunit
LEQADSSVQAQQANVQSQKAAIRAIDYQLENANIYSPLSGIVAARQTEPGQFVGAGSPLMEVVDLSVMELAANVSTKDSAQIKVGMTVTLRIEGLPGQSFTGTVQRISPVAARGTRTIPVYITIQNQDRTLRGGMFATGQITLEEQPETLTIPQTAIHQNDDAAPFVLVVKDNRVVAQPVTLGQTWGQEEALEVTSGLTEGDRIVVLPLPGLNAGDAISLIEG